MHLQETSVEEQGAGVGAATGGIGVAWQDPVSLEGMTVADYLGCGLAKIPAAQCLARVGLDPDEYLARMLGRTLITHEEAMARHADSASLIAGGRIVCRGAVGDVIEQYKRPVGRGAGTVN